MVSPTLPQPPLSSLVVTTVASDSSTTRDSDTHTHTHYLHTIVVSLVLSDFVELEINHNYEYMQF